MHRCGWCAWAGTLPRYYNTVEALELHVECEHPPEERAVIEASLQRLRAMVMGPRPTGTRRAQARQAA